MVWGLMRVLCLDCVRMLGTPCSGFALVRQSTVLLAEQHVPQMSNGL